MRIMRLSTCLLLAPIFFTPASAFGQNAFVTEITTGQTVSTDAAGNGEFPVPFPSGATTAIQVFALGYPSQYREFDLAASPEPINEYRPVYLYSSNQYLTPPIGPGGGQKTLSHGTGQMVTDLAGAPLGEYMQEMQATVPPGSLLSPIRIGFTPIDQVSWNVLYAARDLPQDWRVGAQIQISAFDLNGIEIPSPLFAQPLHIEIDPGLYFDDGNLAGWTAVAYHFDEVLMQWSSLGVSGSGIATNGKLWADLDILQNITFMLIPPSAPSNGGEPGGVTCWWVYAAPRDFDCTEGAPLFTQPTDCPTGSQAPVDSTEEGEYSGEVKAEWAASLGNGLTKLVGKLEGGSSDTSTYSYKKKLVSKLPVNSYPSWDGKIVIRESGVVFERTQWCHDEINGDVEYPDTKESIFIVTGTQICKQGNDGDPDNNGDGIPDGKPCE